MTFSLPELSTLSRALSESSSWISLFILCSERLSITATTFETVATSFDLFTNIDGEVKLLSAVTACIVALWQSVMGVPSSRKSRNWLYILLSIPLLSLGHSKHYLSTGLQQQELTLSTHPIENIVRHAREEFADLLDAQSRTVEQAMLEYTKRYSREPPPNFEKWFNLATQHNFVLVDEFDSMMRAFEPLYGVASSVLQKMVMNAQEQYSDFLIKYEVLDKRITTEGGHEASWFRGSMNPFVPKEWAAILPEYDPCDQRIRRTHRLRSTRHFGQSTTAIAIRTHHLRLPL